MFKLILTINRLGNFSYATCQIIDYGNNIFMQFVYRLFAKVRIVVRIRGFPSLLQLQYLVLNNGLLYKFGMEEEWGNVLCHNLSFIF